MPNLETFALIDCIRDAFYKIGFAPGEPIQAQDAEFARRTFNEILDTYSVKPLAIFNVTFSTFTIVPNKAPNTIGPTNADFLIDPLSTRPVKVEHANIVLTNQSPNVLFPLNIRDDKWWANQRIQSLVSSLPTDLYYSPDVPNGSLYFWPVPDIAYGVQLELWTQIDQFLSVQNATQFPPGYRSALVWTLAELMAPTYQWPWSQIQAGAARQARMEIFSANSAAPTITTKDAGIPNTGRPRPYWNYRTGSNV